MSVCWSRCFPDNFRWKNILISLELQISCRMESKTYRRKKIIQFWFVGFLVVCLVVVVVVTAIGFFRFCYGVIPKNIMTETMKRACVHLKWFAWIFSFVWDGVFRISFVNHVTQTVSVSCFDELFNQADAWSEKGFQQMENELNMDKVKLKWAFRNWLWSDFIINPTRLKMI